MMLKAFFQQRDSVINFSFNKSYPQMEPKIKDFSIWDKLFHSKFITQKGKRW
ncbi:hypothetical protein CBLAS_0926 [Campylobacter blaseri]|nr:hypothetical protein CBLAS_0926 [Campylobacter blaseri]